MDIDQIIEGGMTFRPMRNEQSGRIRASEMIDTLEEILELNDETKNS